MFFKKILRKVDHLSPPNNLYYKGSETHFSTVTGVVSLISVLITALSIIYFIRPMFSDDNPTVSNLEEFHLDAKILELNPSKFYHSVKIIKKREFQEEFDYNSFRVIGIEDMFSYRYIFNSNLNYIDHWVYGPCDDDDIANLNGIAQTEDYDEFYLQFLKTFACIQKYYNADKEQYYDKKESGFRYPNINHGRLNDENAEYSILVEKCQEDTIKLIFGENEFCNNESEIYDTIEEGVNTLLIYQDYYLDLQDYDNPYKKYISEVYDDTTNDFTISTSILLSHLQVKTLKGIFFDSSKKEEIYSHLSNEKSILSQQANSGLLNSYTFTLDNIKKIRVRRYINLMDVFSNIGGFSKIVVAVAEVLVAYYNQYKFLADTKSLISGLYSKKRDLEKNPKRKITLNDNKMEDLKRDNSFSRLNTTSKVNDNIRNNQNESNNVNKNNVNNQTNNDSDSINKINKDTNINQSIDNIPNKSSSPNDENKFSHFKSIGKDLIVDPDNAENIEENSVNNSENSIFNEKNRHVSYWSYLCHKLTCKKKYPQYKIYDTFRCSILSEEQLVKNYILTYNLSKRSNITYMNQITSLKDLINNLENA